MAEIDFANKDYKVQSLNSAFTQDEIQSVLICLHAHRGKYFADPNLGSRLYILKRAKDVERNKMLARQYVEEALAHMVPTRFAKIVVTAERKESGRIDLSIDLYKLTGEVQNILYFVQVGG